MGKAELQDFLKVFGKKVLERRFRGGSHCKFSNSQPKRVLSRFQRKAIRKERVFSRLIVHWRRKKEPFFLKKLLMISLVFKNLTLSVQASEFCYILLKFPKKPILRSPWVWKPFHTFRKYLTYNLSWGCIIGCEIYTSDEYAQKPNWLKKKGSQDPLFLLHSMIKS